jgi:hypothetical protein
MGTSKKPAKKAAEIAKKEARANLAQKDPAKMSLQERKEQIQQTGEKIKNQIVVMTEGTKDNIKQMVNMYTAELFACEDRIEQLTGELKKNKIEVPPLPQPRTR